MYSIDMEVKALVLNPKQKIIFCKGLPGSGKSTWSKQYCLDNPEFVRINKDDVRKIMGSLPYKKSTEEYTLFIQRLIGIVALKNGKSIIVDDTNFANYHHEFWSNIAKNTGIGFEEKYFDTSVEECIRRDSGRLEKVGEAVILEMYKKHVKNTKYDKHG